MKRESVDIVLDFDSTCVTHEFPGLGRDIGAVPVLKRLVAAGHNLILFTMRSDIDNPYHPTYAVLPGNHLSVAQKWFADNDIPLFGVQKHPTQHQWTSSPKAYGHLLIDDISACIPLIKNGKDRPYVDWVKLEEWLESENYFD